MFVRHPVCWPAGRIQISPEHQPAKRKEAKMDPVGMHRPAGPAHDLRVDGIDPVFQNKITVFERSIPQLQPKVYPQAGLKRKIGARLIAGRSRKEPGVRAGPFEHDQQQRQGRESGLGLVRRYPFEHAEGQVEHIHALLFEYRPRLSGGVQ